MSLRPGLSPAWLLNAFLEQSRPEEVGTGRSVLTSARTTPALAGLCSPKGEVVLPSFPQSSTPVVFPSKRFALKPYT